MVQIHMVVGGKNTAAKARGVLLAAAVSLGT